jgi:hypothetical protein
MFALSCVLNCAWLVLWHYERFALTLIVMLGWWKLIAIYQHLNIGYREHRNGKMAYMCLSACI